MRPYCHATRFTLVAATNAEREEDEAQNVAMELNPIQRAHSIFETCLRILSSPRRPARLTA